MITAIQWRGDKIYIGRSASARHPQLIFSQAIEKEGFGQMTQTEQGKVLKEIIEEENLSRDKFILLLPPSAYYLRFLKIPPIAGHRLRKTLQFQVERLLPGLTTEDIVLDYTVLEKTQEGQKVLLVAARKDLIRRHLQTLEKAGYNVQRICPEVPSLLAVYQHAGWIEERPQLLVHVNGEMTNLTLLEGGKPQYCRSFLSRGYDLAEELEKSLLWSQTAPQVSTTSFLSSDEEPESLKNREKLGTIERPDFSALLSEEKKGLADPGKKLALLGATLSPSKNSFLLNLLQGEFRATTSLMQNRFLILCGLVWLNIFFFYLLLSSYSRTDTYKDQFQKIVKKEEKWFRKIFPQRRTFPRQMFLRMVKKKIEKVESGEITPESSRNQGGFLGALKILEKHLQGKKSIRFRRLNFEKDYLDLQGYALKKGEFLNLRSDLQKKENLEIRWSLTKVKKKKETRYRFNLKILFASKDKS